MRRNRKLWGTVVAWDSAWKLAAVVVAIRRRDWKWVVPLLVTNSVGLLPMFYLWRTRGSGEAVESEGA